MLISAIKILIALAFAYFVIVGMVATYLITFAKDEERKRRNEP
jgi:hypothetical protein